MVAYSQLLVNLIESIDSIDSGYNPNEYESLRRYHALKYIEHKNSDFDLSRQHLKRMRQLDAESMNEPVEKKIDNSYKGEHEAPNKNDSPLHDLTKVYPDDIYSPDSVRLYGTGESFDHESMYHIKSAKNAPNKKVKIYRAVPLIKNKDEQLRDLEKSKKLYFSRGIKPHDYDSYFKKPNAYDYFGDKEKEIHSTSDIIKPTINNGDWVTLTKQYAIEHGKSNLNGNYRLLSKTVPVKHVFTDGNSIHEFGYDNS